MRCIAQVGMEIGIVEPACLPKLGTSTLLRSTIKSSARSLSWCDHQQRWQHLSGAGMRQWVTLVISIDVPLRLTGVGMGVDLRHGGNRQAVAEVLGCSAIAVAGCQCLTGSWTPCCIRLKCSEASSVITPIETRLPAAGHRCDPWDSLIGSFRAMVLPSCSPGLLVMQPSKV